MFSSCPGELHPHWILKIFSVSTSIFFLCSIAESCCNTPFFTENSAKRDRLGAAPPCEERPDPTDKIKSTTTKFQPVTAWKRKGKAQHELSYEEDYIRIQDVLTIIQYYIFFFRVQTTVQTANHFLNDFSLFFILCCKTLCFNSKLQKRQYILLSVYLTTERFTKTVVYFPVFKWLVILTMEWSKSQKHQVSRKYI